MRRVRKKGGNKEKVFGCDLLEHLNATSQEVPLVLRCCSEFVEKHGIVDGIYRLSGVSSNIQKLRNEFENDGSPDLNKDVYLQDIHCVSSLCKAYFRELPNPLLTYQLYDKFAEAVAIQLEEERLVKIRDVLKDLPTPHYRTLEFLMRHLVRVASFSSETNMHARNLAIVWAPNLLRSKDIEVSGFNGTAAFMEVRVQSIVVEFILTHVPHLFPDQDVSTGRRNSLPSPTAASCREEGPFKLVQSQPIANYGNISPGDGPLPIRPYHAIIEGTDKRKGSLKGRKWMSIFNIGGRFPDPRRRHKHSTKEKDRPALRPARSMDSLSTPSFPNEGSRRSAQRPPSNNMSTSPLVTHTSQCGPDVAVSTGALGGSEYAVTYRRGTGLVSGGTGTQGTYTALDPDGTGLTGTEVLLSRSPGLTTKVGRRAAMHITGPTLVTVPLHITSNLALGVLQGGGSDRVIHRGRDKEGGERVDGKEGGEKEEEKQESRVMEESRKAEEKEINHSVEVRDIEEVEDTGGSTEAVGGGEEEGERKKEEQEEEEVGKECTWKAEPEMGGEDPPREQRTNSQNSNIDEDADYDGRNVNVNSDYMVMRGKGQPDDQPEETQRGDDDAFDASDVLNSTEVGDDLGLSGYVQDNFEFLDQMDCSVLDHMDCGVPYQVNEFSVEPPGHSDDEYEDMEQARSYCSSETNVQPAETHTQSQTEFNPHRPLSLDLQSRHTKSLSLPYMTSPVHGPDESSSDEEVPDDESDDYLSDEDESMFVKSLPPDFFLSNLPDLESHIDIKDSCTSDGDPVHQLKSSEDLPSVELSACKEVTAGDEEQLEVKEDEDGGEEKETTKKEDEEENKRQSNVTEDDHTVSDDAESDKEEPTEASTHWPESPVQVDDESTSVADVVVEEVADDPHSDSPPCHEVSCEESRDFSMGTTEQSADCVTGVLEIEESDENMQKEATEEDNKAIVDQKHEEETSKEIWDELEDVICEVIEDEETKLQRQSPAEEGDTSGDVKHGKEEEEEEEEEGQTEEVSGEKINEEEIDKIEVRIEEEEESVESGEEKLTDTEMQQEVEDETNLLKTRELDEATQRKYVINDEAQHRDREEVISKDSKEKEKKDEERDEQHSTPPSEDTQPKEGVKGSKEGRKCEESDLSQKGVGRNLVISKQPKIYQVKAVPVVPPKPQHCKITALTLRQQQQQRERRDADRERENLLKVPAEPDRVGPGEDDDGKKEKPTLRGGEKERERRRDGDESATRNTNRNSPLSMCFDEAVAIATMRREREKECEKEKERQRERGNEVQ